MRMTTYLLISSQAFGERITNKIQIVQISQFKSRNHIYHNNYHSSIFCKTHHGEQTHKTGDLLSAPLIYAGQSLFICSPDINPDDESFLASSICTPRRLFDPMISYFLTSWYSPTIDFSNKFFILSVTFTTAWHKFFLRHLDLSATCTSKTVTSCATLSIKDWVHAPNAFPNSLPNCSLLRPFLRVPSATKSRQTIGSTILSLAFQTVALVRLSIAWKNQTRLSSYTEWQDQSLYAKLCYCGHTLM